MTFKPIKYRAHNGYDTEQASDESAVTTTGPSLTAQDMAEDADINVLMRRYGLTGKWPENNRVPMQGDFSEVGDFRSALEAVGRASDQFMQYPADLRARFGNDPGQFAEFCLNDANRDEMVRLKLIKDPTPAEPPGTATVGARGAPPGSDVPKGA